jgi:hypothetical protein
LKKSTSVLSSGSGTNLSRSLSSGIKLVDGATNLQQPTEVFPISQNALFPRGFSCPVKIGFYCCKWPIALPIWGLRKKRAVSHKEHLTANDRRGR